MPRSAGSARSLGGKSRTDSFEIISAPPRNPVIRVIALLIRLRAEITVITVCLTVWFTLRAQTSLPVTITISVGIVVGLGALPWTRRFLLRRATAVMTRHRLRKTLVECRVLNFSRACPIMLWAHPTRVGVTVWLLLRAGISPDDVADQGPEIAAGCFAREARATAKSSMAALVRVEVIRRDPLADNSIDSDLSPWAIGWDSPVIPVGATTTRPTAPDNADVDAPVRRERVTVVPAPEPFPAADNDYDASSGDIDGSAGGGRGGDWSDYV